MNWIALILTTLPVTALFAWLHIPAAVLVGPLLVAILFAQRTSKPAVPPIVRTAAQALIGAAIAVYIADGFAHLAPRQIPVMVAIASVTLVWTVALARWMGRNNASLQRRTALWGIMPGASSAMIVLAEQDGADFRIVAVMQYFRVLVVALLAALMAALLPAPQSDVLHLDTAPAIGAAQIAGTCVVAVAALLLGRMTGFSASVLMIAAFGGAAVKAASSLPMGTPGWLLWPAYAAVGWHTGLGFDRTALRMCRDNFLPIVGSTITVVAGCVIGGGAIGWTMGLSPLTAVLAASPGGVDTIMIVAATSAVDLPFILAAQSLRFAAVMTVGVWLGRGKRLDV